MDSLLASMPAVDFNRWRAFYEVDPWGGERSDLQAMYVGQMSVAPYTKGSSVPHHRDFLPSFAAVAPARQSMQEQKKIFGTAKKAFDKAASRKR